MNKRMARKYRNDDGLPSRQTSDRACSNGRPNDHHIVMLNMARAVENLLEETVLIEPGNFREGRKIQVEMLVKK